MERLITRRLRDLDFIIDYVLQLCLVIGLAGLTVLFWPEGVFRTPLAMIPFGDWFWTLVSALVGALTALVAHCLVIKTAIILFKAIRPSESKEESLPAADSEPLASGRE
ncbi:MAG TPA: hypothetical protein VJ828_15065 [Lacipirellulaceae bacterium]|nr:hypothetical protein [Lacipirellulaceae bacterium]